MLLHMTKALMCCYSAGQRHSRVVLPYPTFFSGNSASVGVTTQEHERGCRGDLKRTWRP